MTEPSATADKPRLRRRPLQDFPLFFWSNTADSFGTEVTKAPDDEFAAASSQSDDAQEETADSVLESPEVSEHAVCNTCILQFLDVDEQRAHFKTDFHRYNLKRKMNGKPPVEEETFEDNLDCLSESSISGSDEEAEDVSPDDDGEDDSVQGTDANRALGVPTANDSVKLQFPNPASDGGFLIVYKAALPDQTSLASLRNIGSWIVIMAGGGHFCAAMWGRTGNLLQHKSFHRYTTRRKQGGSQAAADDSRGGGRYDFVHIPHVTFYIVLNVCYALILTSIHETDFAFVN